MEIVHSQEVYTFLFNYCMNTAKTKLLF